VTGSILALIHRWNLPQFLYDWQTVVAGALAVAAAAGTIWTTFWSTNRELLASKEQIAVARQQIETTLRLERQRDEQRERDRADRAEVVAFRLSGWLSEVGLRVLLKLKDYDEVLRSHPTMPSPPIRYFDAYLDRAGSHIFFDAGREDEIYKNIGDQLARMRALHAAAERHLAPIIDAAVQIVGRWKLDVAVGIQTVLSDLHYLARER
jgi:hypothetical protein